jgi:hypothetical protein
MAALSYAAKLKACLVDLEVQNCEEILKVALGVLGAHKCYKQNL